MTLERWIEFQQGKGNDAGVAMGRTLLAQYGDLPLGSQETVVTQSNIELHVASELDLVAEWQRQSSRFIELGFHKELGHADTDEGKMAYLDSLPKFAPQPENYAERFDVPLLVERRIHWERQAQLGGIAISDYLRERIDRITPFAADSQPEGAYTGWFSAWGQLFESKIGPFDARKQLADDELGGGLLEGVAMQLAHPEYNQNNQYFDLIGDQVESGDVPYLNHWDGGPGLNALWSGDASVYFRPLVRGSKIVTG